MQKVGVDRERRLAAFVLCHGDLVLLGELDQVAARLKLPFPPRRDHFDVGVERIVGELEAHLVVTLAGGAMGHRVGAGLMRNLDLALGYERPRDRGAEQVHAFVERIGAERGKHEIAHELLAQILDENLLHAHHLGLLARRPELLALAEIGSKGHNLAAVGLLQPFQDDRGIEPAGISEHYLLDVGRHGRLAGGGRAVGIRGTIGRRGGYASTACAIRTEVFGTIATEKRRYCPAPPAADLCWYWTSPCEKSGPLGLLPDHLVVIATWSLALQEEPGSFFFLAAGGGLPSLGSVGNRVSTRFRCGVTSARS